jgi:hypothetical protein
MISSEIVVANAYIMSRELAGNFARFESVQFDHHMSTVFLLCSDAFV